MKMTFSDTQHGPETLSFALASAGATSGRDPSKGRSPMKYSRLAILMLAAACWASQSLAMPGDAGDMGTVVTPGEEHGPSSTGAQPSDDSESTAEDLWQNGKCKEAIPILRRLAAMGADHAISQDHLGLCLFNVAKSVPDAAQAAGLRREAAQFIIQSANNGFPNAQLQAVTIYLDGYGVAVDPVEAGKWSLIYQSNSLRYTIGLPDISEELQARLDKALTGKSWDEAQARASGWAPSSQNTSSSN